MPTLDVSQADGLIALYKADEASGDLIDSSYHRHTATAQGNIAYEQVGKPALGKGYGVSPTDGNVMAIVPSSSNGTWNDKCPLISVQVWFKAGSAFNAMPGSKHALVYKATANADTSGWFLGVLPGGGNNISFRVMDAATSAYTATYTETEFTQFHHYVGTLDGSFVRLYRDGVQVAQTVVSGTLGFNAAILTRIGEGITGTLDEIAVWNRVLTVPEIQKLYGQGGYINFRKTYRVPDFIPFASNSGNPFPVNALYVTSPTFVIGPFLETVQVRAGDNLGTDNMTAPDDQWVINGVDWTTPAWVNTSTPHVIAGGTVLATLTPGQTLLIQIRSKTNSGSLQASGKVSTFALAAVADGLEIVQPFALSYPGVSAVTGPTNTDLSFGYLSATESLEASPPAVDVPFDLIGVPFDALAATPIGFVAGTAEAAYNVYEDVLIPPNPLVVSVSVAVSFVPGELHTLTLVGEAGFTTIPYVDLFWEIALSTGYLTIPVSPIWDPFTLTIREQFTTTFEMLDCMRFNGAAIRFVAQSHGPGSTDQAVRYTSPWQTMTGADFDSRCEAIAPPPPIYPGSVMPLADVAPVVNIDLFDVVSADVSQETIYKPTPAVSENCSVTPLTNEPQNELDLPAGLYEFEYTNGALYDAVSGMWNFYFGSYFGQRLGGMWIKSGLEDPYYVIAAPCFTNTGFASQAAAELASIGHKFLFLHTGGKLSFLTDYDSGANSGSIEFTIRNVDSIMFGAGDWTLLDTTMTSNPYLDPTTGYSPKLRQLEPGYTRFRYTAFVADNKARSQDFVVRVWSRNGSVDASFPYDAPKAPPNSPLGYGGTVRDRRVLFTPPPTTGNRG